MEQKFYSIAVLYQNLCDSDKSCVLAVIPHKKYAQLTPKDSPLDVFYTQLKELSWADGPTDKHEAHEWQLTTTGRRKLPRLLLSLFSKMLPRQSAQQRFLTFSTFVLRFTLCFTLIHFATAVMMHYAPQFDLSLDGIRSEVYTFSTLAGSLLSWALACRDGSSAFLYRHKNWLALISGFVVSLVVLTGVALQGGLSMSALLQAFIIGICVYWTGRFILPGVLTDSYVQVLSKK